MEYLPEVWVWAERSVGRIARVSLELLSKGGDLAQRLRGRLAVVLIGNNLRDAAQELIGYGAQKVYLIEDPGLELYQSNAYTRLLAESIQEHRPEVVLLGATSLGKELASRVAARLEIGLVAHCVDLYVDENGERLQLVQVVPGWSGNLMLKILCPERRPQMATIRAGIMELPSRDESRRGEVIVEVVSLKKEDFRIKTIKVVEEKPVGAELEEAEVVVAGGWGLYSAGGFELARELAQLLKGVVAGTRPVVDKGLVPEEHLLGQSGKMVSPKLTFSLGASGAMHFTTGFLKSKVILAVDLNPEAPIFEICDIGIVGDLREILPRLVEELKEGYL